MKDVKAQIVKIEQVCKENYKIVFESEYISQNARPGQFVNIKCSDNSNRILRRPISIHKVDRDNNVFEIMFQIRGKGTKELSDKKPGEILDVLGPLGKGFTIKESYNKVAFIGGGMGTFPLLFTAIESNSCKKDVFMGYRSCTDVMLKEEFESNECNVYIATDDGTYGYKGFVTDLFEKMYLQEQYDMVYVCGPEIMAKRVKQIVESANRTCQISLEERMGCGIGACLVCACEVKVNGKKEYAHVCKDGPVFWSNEIFCEDE